MYLQYTYNVTTNMYLQCTYNVTTNMYLQCTYNINTNMYLQCTYRYVPYLYLHSKKKRTFVLYFTSLNNKNMTLVLSVINFKGGVGKTTTATNLASCLTAQGKKVLVIDMDAQGNVGMSVGINVYQEGLLTIGDVLATTSVKIEQCIIKNPYFDVIPNNLYTYLKTNKRASYDILTDALEGIKKKYDFIIIDTPPSIEFYTCNAILASDMMLIVTDYSKFSVEGVKILMSVFDGMQGKVASKLKHSPRAILFTMYKNTSTFKALTTAIEKQTHLGLFLDVKIPSSADVGRSPYQGVPVSQLKKKTNTVRDAYQELAVDMIDFVAKKQIYNSKYHVNF